MLTISRRGLLALGGAAVAGTGVAACGTDEYPRDEGRDPELLGAMLAAELGVEASAKANEKQPQEAQAVAELVSAIARASAARVRTLRGLAQDAGGSEANQPQGAPTLPALADASERAIAAYHEGAGLLSNPDLRSTASSYLAQSAAEVAALRGQLGDDPVPAAFVTGGSVKPYAFSSDTTTSTTSTTTTETTTGSGG